MSLWVKICGNTSLADAQFAVDAGADAVGFVFARSPRHVTPGQVATITQHLPASIEKIGVFVDTDLATISAAVELAALTGVQLHSESSDDLSARLREHFGPRLRILRVIHFGADAVRRINAVQADTSIDGVLVDSRTATAVGGTGIAFDWEAARASIFSGNGQLKLIAAGGLNPENVAEAIAVLSPWGVDVVTGVESYPGRKDPVKVHDFVLRARSAFASQGKLSTNG
jgi:phosphoribosylanthranilate isomerase